jgi:glycosyltransferase involved in cell wall biosynthesis
MNILVFAHDSSLYGASQSLLTALKGIKKKANRKILVLLPYPGKMEELLRSEKIEYSIIPFPRCVAFNHASYSRIQRVKNIVAYYFKTSYIFPRLLKIARQFNPDVIYTNTSVVSVGFRVAKHLNIPHVWHIREFGDIDFNFEYYPNREKIMASINDSQKSIFASHALKNHWIKSDSDRHTVVYNGIADTEYGNKESFRRFPKEHHRIGLLGAILPGKGQHIAIEAFAKLLENKIIGELFFYGDVVDHDYLNSLQKLVRSLKVEDKVIFKTFVNDKDLIYQNLDLVLNCSEMEGFGRTIVEAMGHGIPVIANASGGALEIINDEIDGLLYDGTSESLFFAMAKCLSDERLYESLSSGGLQRSRKFSVENYTDAIDNILLDASSESLSASSIKFPKLSHEPD